MQKRITREEGSGVCACVRVPCVCRAPLSYAQVLTKPVATSTDTNSLSSSTSSADAINNTLWNITSSCSTSTSTNSFKRYREQCDFWE